LGWTRDSDAGRWGGGDSGGVASNSGDSVGCVVGWWAMRPDSQTAAAMAGQRARRAANRVALGLRTSDGGRDRTGRGDGAVASARQWAGMARAARPASRRGPRPSFGQLFSRRACSHGTGTAGYGPRRPHHPEPGPRTRRARRGRRRRRTARRAARQTAAAPSQWWWWWGAQGATRGWTPATARLAARRRSGPRSTRGPLAVTR
jgi:hypothetical protein